MFQVTSRKDTGNWIDSSIKADPNPQLRAKLLEDDEYLANMREREPIYKFIIQNFVFDPNDVLCYSKHPILLLGYESTPLACELSQWRYPVTLVLANFFEEVDAKKIMARHNGNVKIARSGEGHGKIVAWIDNGKMSGGNKMEYIKYLSQKCGVLIISTPSSEFRERIMKEIKNVAYSTKFGGTPLLIIYN